MRDDEFAGLGFEGIAKKIESMEIRGGAKIARAAAHALKDEASKDEGELVERINKAGERLKRTRPTAVSLQNALRFVIKDKKAEVTADMIKERAESFIEKSYSAGKR